MENDLQQTKYYRDLRRKISQHFKLAEIKVLCFDIGFEYENLAGEEKDLIIANLIRDLSNRGTLNELLELLNEERPKVDWDANTPSPEQQIRDAQKLGPPSKDDLILREYFEKLNQFLPANALEEAKQDEQLRQKIYILTRTYLQQLDLFRRSRLVRYLGENNLQTVVSLKGVDLAGADLSGINLQHANLIDADLSEAFLANSSLQDANLIRAKLDGAYLAESNLQRVDFSWATISGASFNKANIQGANLTRAIDIKSSVFLGADLRNAKLPDYGYSASIILSKFEYLFEDALLNQPSLLLIRIKKNLEYHKNYEIILNDCNQLCELAEENSWFHFVRGVVYQALDQTELAQRDFTIALSLSNTNEELLPILFRAALGEIAPEDIPTPSPDFDKNNKLTYWGTSTLLKISPKNKLVKKLKDAIEGKERRGWG